MDKIKDLKDLLEFIDYELSYECDQKRPFSMGYFHALKKIKGKIE